MKTSIDHSNHFCQIWVPNSEKASYRKTKEFMSIMEKCREQQLRPCVFIGGQQPLVPTISSLLDEQNPPQYRG